MLGYNKDQVRLSRRIVLKRNLNIYNTQPKCFYRKLGKNVFSKTSLFKSLVKIFKHK